MAIRTSMPQQLDEAIADVLMFGKPSEPACYPTHDAVAMILVILSMLDCGACIFELTIGL